MFRAEAEVMHRMNHSNIVAIIDDPIIDDTPCLAMEYVRGRNIDQILTKSQEKDRPLPVEAMIYIMIEVLKGLDHVHNATLENGEPLRLVHRDLTPGNLIISFDGDVKITDFGISKSQMSRVSTTVGIVKGKARYLSPEQIVGEPATTQSDLFACACVCVELVSGRPLFDVSNVHQTLHSIVNNKRKKVSDLITPREPKLIEAIETSLSKNPKKRHRNAREFCLALQQARDALKSNFGRTELSDYLAELFSDSPEPWELEIERERSSLNTSSISQIQDAKSILEDSTPSDQHSMAAANTMPAIAKIRPKLTPYPQANRISDESITSVGKEDDEEDTKVSLDLSSSSNIPPSANESVQMVDRPAFIPTPRAKSFEGAFKFKRYWPILFATFGLGLATGVIATISIVDNAPQTVRNEVVPVSLVIPPPPKPQATPDTVLKPSIKETPSKPKAQQTKSTLRRVNKGSLSVYGPKGARITIDGKRLRSRVPLVAHPITAGKHRIQISKGRYRRSSSVTISPQKNSVLKFRKRKRSRRK